MSYGRMTIDTPWWAPLLLALALLGGAVLGAYLDQRDLPPAAMEEVD